MKRLKVKVLYFGPAQEAAGGAEELVLLGNPAFLQDLVNEILKSHEDLDKMKIALKMAVNEEVVDTNVELHHGDEVAILPPVAGG